jgi:translin
LQGCGSFAIMGLIDLTIDKQWESEATMAENFDTIGREATEHLALKNAARERALPKSRSAIRYCANSIRAAHRHEFAAAAQLLGEAADLLQQMAADLRDHQDIYYAGFVQDAQKEFAEASTFVALVQHQPLPDAEQLGLGWAAFLNGLGEAVGELRRYLLDQLRRGNIENCEVYLGYMDDIYAILTSIDYPDAITSGLRRTTDMARGILEKTRGDLTIALEQAQLQRTMLALQQELQQHKPGA